MRRRFHSDGDRLPEITHYRGEWWRSTQLTLVEPLALTPEGYTTQFEIDRMIEQPTKSQPDRLLVIWRILHYETHRQRIARMRSETRTRRAKKLSTKGSTKP